MDDPHFDHRSAKRFDQQRATGPFGVDEILPKKISAWTNRKHPDTGKQQTLLNFVEWQRGQAVRILQDFELHTYEWTLTAVKYRQSLDKQDKRDVAQSVFAQDRDGRLAEHIAFLRSQTLEQEGDDQLMAEQVAQNLAAFRFAIIDDLIAAEDNDVAEPDRALLMTGTEMTRTEFDLLLTLIRVFDHARSHFVFEICDPATRRFLNALRIRHEEGGDRMEWSRYKNALLERMQNSSTIDGLISFILKPRDNGCPISLWVAERIAERRLLNEDGIDMSEDTWLELVLAFVTNEEKQTLQVPARDQRANFDEGAGYTINLLQQSLGRFDPATFKKFQQGHCHDPVAVRVVSLHKLVSADRAASPNKGRTKQQLENHALTKDQGRSNVKPNDKFDKKSALPVKEGKPDQDLYASFPEKSLRRRLWDAVVSGKCTRCNGPHLRVACPKPRQGWEDDFEKESFFSSKPPPAVKKQVRVQLTGSSLNLPVPQILSVMCPLGRCLVDTCSDVSVARRDVLSAVHHTGPHNDVLVGHLGGETLLQDAGTLELGRFDGLRPVRLTEVYVVEPDMLPAGVVALFGVSDIRTLGLSLDDLMANPGRPWEQSVKLSWLGRIRRYFRRSWRSSPPPEAQYAGEAARTIPFAHHPQSVPPIRRGGRPDLPDVGEGNALLEATKAHLSEEQERRTANRVAALFREGLARKRALQAKNAFKDSMARSSSSATMRSDADTWPRKRAKHYAVRIGREPGIYSTWEECEKQTKGVTSEFKSFGTLEEAVAYMKERWPRNKPNARSGGRRLMFMTFRRPQKPASSFMGGSALRAQVDVWQDGHYDSLRVDCGLDTMSDVNLALVELLHDVHDIIVDDVRSSNGHTEFAREGTLKLLYEGEVVSVPALVAVQSQLPRSCDVCLGMPGLNSLSVSLEEHRREQRLPLMCHVGEKTLRTWWEANEGQAAPAVAHDITQVDVNPDLPAVIQAKVRALLRKHEGVFEGRQVTMPKPFQAEPVQLKFIDDPVPQSVPEPRWTFAQRNVLTQWAEAGLKDGSLELSTSRWASRPHIVMKTPANQHKDLVDISKCKLRVCGDYRAVNSQIAKIVPNLPTGLEEVEKAAGHLWYWESDSVACYSQFTLAAGRSREALAIWTPLGLVQPTTLPFGQKNSGTEAQGPYRAAASEMNRGRHGNYVDDWIGYSNELDQLIEDFECFLKVCEKYVITLGTAKTRFGYAEAQFFGFRVNKAGSHLALKHLDPIRSLVPPNDIHELRRVLGLFVVSRKYLPDYALVSRPMTEILRGKPPTFRWGTEQQAAFDRIRDLLLKGVHLAAPDFALPFHLATDASEDGKGGELYQLPSIPIDQQYPYDAKIHAAINHAVIFFLSKAWDETQRLRPPFYLEGDSLLWCTLKSKYYALSSPFPLYTYSDHMPLKWMEKTEKGPISSFILEHLSEFNTVHQYIQGKVNTLPDACSRYPMLGPKQLATRGLANSVAEMLRRLPERLKGAKLVHYHGGKHNAELRVALRDWFQHVGALQPTTPPSKAAPVSADLAILVPRCEVAPVALARYLLSSTPFALLMPVDLLAMASTPNLYRQSPHAEIAARFAATGKITILATQMTWVIGNLTDCHPVETFSNTLRTPAPVTGFGERQLPDGGQERIILDNDALDEVEGTVPRTLEAWVRAQRLDEGFPDLLEKVEDKALQNELWIQVLPGRTPTIIVPRSCQELLIRDTHTRMHHLNHAKVYAALKRSYSFPEMKTWTRKLLEDCPECELNKARQMTAHALFHSAPVHAPRAKWCMDFQGQGTALTGETEVLALIDPTSRYVVVIPLRDRQASTWLQPFLDRIVFTFGAPDVLHSDDAPEFLSEALELLAQAADIKTTTTLGHNARGNATIEVWWRFWNRCLRLLSDEHYARWPDFASRIAFAYNSAPHEGIGAVTAFQIYHGTDPRDTLGSSLADPPTFTEDEELKLPAQFAQAVALSTQVFTAMAKNHDQFVKTETSLRLNQKGTSRVFEVGEKVKVRVPPTQAQLLSSGRRAKHVTAWRGPCTIVERLSTTAYAAVDDTTKRRYERVIANILPYKAARAKLNAAASFSQTYSAPFSVGEYIAIRDEPTGPYYVALVQKVTAKCIRVQYYGTTSIVLADAVFKPCWNNKNSDEILLQWDLPDRNDALQKHFVAYTGEIDLKDVHTVLVARQLEFTKAGKLRFRALRSLAPVHDQLFRFTL